MRVYNSKEILHCEYCCFVILANENLEGSKSLEKDTKLFNWLETHEHILYCLCQESFNSYFIGHVT